MIINAEKIIILGMLLLGLGAIISFFIRDFKIKSSIGLLISFVVSVLTITAVYQVSYGLPSDGIILSLPLFDFLKFRVHVDGVSAIFLFLLGIVLPFIFQYSTAYVKSRPEMKNFCSIAFLLTLSVYGLLVVADTFIILGIFWQMLVFSGWWLIGNGENKRSKNAAKNFFIWMQIGCVLVICGAVLLSVICNVSNPSYFELFDFNTMSERMGDTINSNPFITNVAVLMFLLGFGIKLGVVPFGLFWLPDSYDSAPSPVSALFSAIVSKTGLYGLVRTFLNLLPENATEMFNYQIWGIILGSVGAITLIVATWRALIENEIKRILAYSSMATAGLILISLGVCVSILPLSDKASVVATSAIIGAFVHFINHGIVNAILFINTGVVLSSVRSRVIGSFAGLAKYLPLSCLCGFIASLSAAGLPPLNGFTGKWFIYTSAIKSSTNVPVFAILSGVAILAGIATVVIFVKYFGSIYLSKPMVRSDKQSDNVRLFIERDYNTILPQIGLCFITLIFSVFPQMLLNLITKLLIKNPHGFGKLIAKGIHRLNEYDMGMHWGFGYASAGVFATMAFAYSVATIFSKSGNSRKISAEPWLCGYQKYNQYTQYPASQLCHELINKVKQAVPLGFKSEQNVEMIDTDKDENDGQNPIQTGCGAGNKINRDNDF